MNLEEFKDKISETGLARSGQWLCRIYPPSGVSAVGKALDDVFLGGNKAIVDLPIVDSAVGLAQTAGSFFGSNPINTGQNLSSPTSSFIQRNLNEKVGCLNLYTTGCKLPSRDLLNTEWEEYGEKRSLGILHTHGDFQITHYCSEDLREKQFFEEWQDIIFNPRNKQHGYYKSYISTVEVSKFDYGWQNEVAAYRFNECYPTNVGAIDLTHAGDRVLEITTTWKYRNYTRIR